MTLQDQTGFCAILPQRKAEHWIVWLTLLLAVSLAATSCGHKKKTQASLPPPPPVSEPTYTPPAEPLPAPPEPPKSAPWTQTGIASWYFVGPGGHKTASGESYNAVELTAAHRTLPFQSLVRVTNLKTKSQVVVRINDRGPFINGRVIDLSLAAAKKLDIRQSGLAKVKLEVMHTPTAIITGGKWGVQIGAFRLRQDALVLKQTVAARYRTARVSGFSGTTGYWLLVRVQDDDRLLAQTVASNIKTSEGGVYIVRLN